MTKDNPVAAGVAELLPCPFCGGTHITDRHVRDGRQMFCQSCGSSVAATYHGANGDTLERAIAAWNSRAASPVQAGIDPLVAEIEADDHERGCQGREYTCTCGYDERQAARIAELEDDIRIGCGNIDAAIDDYNTERNRRIAAESLLAEAREALEPFAARAERYNDSNTIRINDDVELWQIADNSGMSLRDLALTVGDLRKARATLSRLKPGEKGGGE